MDADLHVLAVAARTAARGQPWTPSEWIALAGVVATLLGVVLGAYLARRVAERERVRDAAETALVAAEAALGSIDVEDLRMQDLKNTASGRDPSRLLRELERGGEVAAARAALLSLRVRHPKSTVRDLTRALERNMSWAHFDAVRWYHGLVDYKTTGNDEARQQSINSATDARRELEEARSLLERLRKEIT